MLGAELMDEFTRTRKAQLMWEIAPGACTQSEFVLVRKELDIDFSNASALKDRIKDFDWIFHCPEIKQEQKS